MRITANQVTLARLIPMPLLAYWIYNGDLWPAMVVGTLVACTDFVDGWMARRAGPTVLGGLLDPIADKVFVALIYLPFADLDVIPAWACALMFVREFVVTALRSAYERRGMTMKTSYLGKVKTWTQMQGIGVLLLFPMVGYGDVMTALLVIGIVAPMIAMAALWIIKRKLWKGALVMTGSFVALYAVYLQRDPELVSAFIMMLVVALTWVSGVDYLVGGVRQLSGRGDFARHDGIRVVGSIALPVMVFLVAERVDVAPWTLLTILAMELAVGGLDNLLSHHHRAANTLGWGARVVGVCGLLGGALAQPAYGTWFAAAAAVVSTVGVAIEFWRGRDCYLDARLRNQPPERKQAAMLRAQSSG